MQNSERPELAPLTTRSERVKRVAALSGRSARKKTQNFRVEGPQAVRELLAQQPQQANVLYLTETAHLAHPELVKLAQTAKVPAFLVNPSVISAMVKEQGSAAVINPQGVIAIAKIPTQAGVDFQQTLAQLPKEGSLTLVVCERIQDPGNAGVLLRTADAAGAHAVFFSQDSVDIYSPKVVRASVGSLFHTPVATAVEMAELLAALKELDITVAGTSPRGKTNLFSWQSPQRIAWIMGNEAAGLSEQTMQQCDYLVSIPIYGKAESLNLATAATLCLFESARQQEK